MQAKTKQKSENEKEQKSRMTNSFQREKKEK